MFQFCLPSEMNSKIVHSISKKEKKTISEALMYSQIFQFANQWQTENSLSGIRNQYMWIVSTVIWNIMGLHICNNIRDSRTHKLTSSKKSNFLVLLSKPIYKQSSFYMQPLIHGVEHHNALSNQSLQKLVKRILAFHKVLNLTL